MAENQKITIYDVVDDIRDTCKNETEKGTRFERAIRYFLLNDPLWSSRLKNVWLWKDATTNNGHDIGIDLVGLDRGDGSYWAIQCKCWDDTSTLTYHEVATFYAAAGSNRPEDCDARQYAHKMLVTTNVAYSAHLETVAAAHATVRLNLDVIAASPLDFRPFLEGKSPAQRVLWEPRPDQREMIDLCKAGFDGGHDRGKLIMACGTGKTFTALRMAEEVCGTGSLILYLAPSIALVAQSMRAWANQARWPLKVAVVCSDAKASNTTEDTWESSLADVPYPATTDAAELHAQLAAPYADGLTVIFSTYQSIQVVSDAQRMGLKQFNLIICDEAHRTTGAVSGEQAQEEASEFVKVHDNAIISAARRLYMTATPKIYGERVKKQAHTDDYVISSMDDESIYGPEFGHISFGRAVDEGLLSDYKVIALTVSEDAVSQAYQLAMTGEDGKEFELPEAAKIIGVWKGLVNQGEKAGRVLHNAVAFCNTIAESKRTAEFFMKVVDSYRKTEHSASTENLICQLDHVDGSMDAVTRKRKLDWLADPNDGTAQEPICRILTNARCLSEGVDVPSLDAVLFMQPKRSEIDIVQAVGRVMRKFEGKEYGYIILPVIIPSGMSEQEALDASDAYAIVWKVLQALRSHDERLEARINAIPYDHNHVVEVEPATPPIAKKPETTQEEQQDGQIQFEGWRHKLEEAVNAQLLKKVGTRVYWDEWAKSISDIAQKHITRISVLVQPEGPVRAEFRKFLQGLRDSLNNGITEEAAIEMLAQHMITLPVFEALFAGDGFAASNPVSIAMEGMVNVLRQHDFGVSLAEQQELKDLYESVRIRASAIKTDAGRQNVIKELYEKFFSQAFKATSEKMGIVYTPNEVVTFMLHAADRLLKKEFGRGLGDEGVHILDPFTGTGSFPVSLLEDRELISDAQLENKYRGELHANEIVLLAYYIAAINIEHAYHSRHPGSYEPFPGAVLTDTFQMDEENGRLDIETFVDNSERVLRQKETPIHVIVGNPPYSVGQRSANDNNANESYPTLDRRIGETYAQMGGSNLKKGLYDSYIRSFRWASDRIGNHGVIAFVTNAGWLDGSAMDGFRKCLCQEFNSIYVFNLRGNARLQGEQRRKEKDNIFGQGTRTPVAITLLVKNPASPEQGVIRYHDIGDYLTREQKLAIVRNNVEEIHFVWDVLTPDRHGDWLKQRSDNWYQFIPLGLNNKANTTPNGAFSIYSLGVSTNRDSWVYNYSGEKVARNVSRSIDFYNHERLRYQNAGVMLPAEDFVERDSQNISWTHGLWDKIRKDTVIKYDSSKIRVSLYRPYCKQQLYYDTTFNERPGQQTVFFPDAKQGNLIIALSGSKGFCSLISNVPVDLHFVGDTQCFPLYHYSESDNGTLTRQDAITDEALQVFRRAFPCCFEYQLPVKRKNARTYYISHVRNGQEGGPEITKEDIFYYIYGVLHSPEYRSRFDANLQKELPRIPLVGNDTTFRAFADAGRKLANLHLNYERADRWNVQEMGENENPGSVVKMKWGKKRDSATGKNITDYSTLVYNANLTLRGIPERAQLYVVNGKSALNWLVDRYQVRTDSASGIVNDPNDYSENPRFIVDLIERVITVSMKTLDIVETLPSLNEQEQPANWPEAWKLNVGG